MFTSQTEGEHKVTQILKDKFPGATAIQVTDISGEVFTRLPTGRDRVLPSAGAGGRAWAECPRHQRLLHTCGFWTDGTQPPSQRPEVGMWKRQRESVWG